LNHLQCPSINFHGNIKIYFHFIVTISILPFKSIVSKFVSCYSHFVFMNARTLEFKQLGCWAFFALMLKFDFVFKWILTFPLLCHNEVDTLPLSLLKFTTFAYTTFQHAIFNSIFFGSIYWYWLDHVLACMHVSYDSWIQN
jgi:hypothetical protein